MNRSSVAAVGRIGWRSIGRNRRRSALIVALILLPVAAMVAGITLVATLVPSPDESARRSMGQADFVVYPGSDRSTTDELIARLPPESVAEPAAFAADRLVLPGRELGVSLWSLDLSGLARGKLELSEGRQPADVTEVAVSRRLAQTAGVQLGGQLTLRDRGARTVVGFVENPFELSSMLVAEHSSVARGLAAGGNWEHGQPYWLVALPPGVDGAEYIGDGSACDDECPFYGSSRAQAGAFSSSIEVNLAILVLGGLALFEALLIASAAFAVSVRRRQRELGLLAAAGAERRHMAGTVLSEAALLGGLGVLLGIATGIAGVLALSPWLSELADRRIGAVNLDLAATLAAGGLGFLACLLAATLPARSAARLPVLAALAGRRPPLAAARRLALAGGALIIAATLMTMTGAAALIAGEATIGAVVLLGGSMLGVVGFGAWSPWLIEHLERLGLHLPVAARIAVRDTARARSRNSPIVTAVLAAFALTVAFSAFIASSDAANAASWRPYLRSDQIILHGEGASAAGPAAARALEALAAAPIPGLVEADGSEVYLAVEDPRRAEGDREVAWNLTIADGELLAALAAEASEVDLERGTVVVFTTEPLELEEVELVVRRDSDDPAPESWRFPARVVVTGLIDGVYPGAVISQAMAEQLGVATAGSSPFNPQPYLMRLSRPVEEVDLARAAEYAARYPETYASSLSGPQRPYELFRYILIGASLAFALIITGVAVALGEAEGRADQRTLLAVGADPRIRRRISAGRAAVVALLAGILAVPAGLLPAWGILSSREQPLVVPLPEIVAAVIILPLAGIVGALLLTRGIPPWSALRDVAS
jgi:putative ABC transport system permease protein